MPRPCVKVLLLDPDDRVLLLKSLDPADGSHHWSAVGGGIEGDESLQDAAAREAHEETGLTLLPAGRHVWVRDTTYHLNGESKEVHEDWLLVRVDHFDPVVTSPSGYESLTFLGARWWSVEELDQTHETVYPEGLGAHLRDLLRHGPAGTPVHIA